MFSSGSDTGAGFDEDPVDFYLPFIERLETQSTSNAREEFKRFRQSTRVDRPRLEPLVGHHQLPTSEAGQRSFPVSDLLRLLGLVAEGAERREDRVPAAQTPLGLLVVRATADHDSEDGPGPVLGRPWD